jgi:two-component system phosphate regulon sensor histidine kinase PhoR
MIHPQGFPANIEWYSAPVYQDNHIFGRIYLFHDSSARRTAAALRANFLSRVSHELRTPLTSIKGFAEFILEACKDDLPDLAREYTEIILKSSRHLNAVFSDIIEISRADTGELKLTIAPARLPDLIINAVASMEMQYRAKNQQMVMDLNDDLPPVQVDVIRIAQVLNNLLSNAIKFAPLDSAIHIDMAYVDSAADLPASAPPDVVTPALLVIVTNGGKGLTPEEAERVFLPFFQTKDAQATRQEGTGLGLTIARSFVELHRGKIWAEPRRPGQWGARFLFTLPAAES